MKSITVTELASHAQIPSVRAEIQSHEMSAESTCDIASGMRISFAERCAKWPVTTFDSIG